MRCNGSWQLVSRCCQNPETAALCGGLGWGIRVGLYRGWIVKEFSEVVWSYLHIWRFEKLATAARKVWHPQLEICSSTFALLTGRLYDLLHGCNLNNTSTNSFICSGVRPLVVPRYCSCPILRKGNFLLAYWSAALPSQSSLLTLILSWLFCWGSTELARHATSAVWSCWTN